MTVSSAGHAYFALKDERNQLQCVWFRDDRVRSAFAAQAGLRVVVHGRVDLYEPTGAMQLYVDSIQPAGLGDLALRFEALKARLAAEGLFDTARKRPLPSRPRTIAVVTSPSGAVWRDISHVLARRWPLVQVVLVAAQVQGDGAPASIVTALRRIARYAEAMHDAGRPDDAPALTILARGGGSLEDLWAFNDERVVRAVVAHPLPVVCGVGHEVDVTLADFAADVRAAHAVRGRGDRRARSARDGRRRSGAPPTASRPPRNVVLPRPRATSPPSVGRSIGVSPAARLAAAREQVGLLFDRATRAVDARLGPGASAARDRGVRVAPLRCRPGRDRAVGRSTPRRPRWPSSVRTPTLERGYAIVRRGPDGAIVRDPHDAPAGSPLRIRVARGEIAATVDEEPGA